MLNWALSRQALVVRLSRKSLPRQALARQRVFGTANSAEPNVPDMSSAKAEEAATTPENQKKEAVANLNEPQRLNSAQKAEEISKAVEPKDGKPGTVPPNQEREGYVADLDE